MIKGGFFNDGFGDLLGKLVEVPQVLIPAVAVAVATRSCVYTSISRVCRRMTAFIHYRTLSLSLTHTLSHSLSLCFVFVF